MTQAKSKIVAIGTEVAKQQKDLADVREATSTLIQWNKMEQQDEAERQVKLLGWRQESRMERRQA
eukprot:7528370-Alexandrium_andersonii.AAC.1